MHSYESTKKLMQTKVLDSKCLLFDKVIPDTDECQKFETIRKKIHPNEDEDSQYLIETAKKQIYYNDNDKIS